MTPFVRRASRQLLLATGLVFIVAGPLAVQGLGVPLTPWTHGWQMFRSAGMQTCEVRYHHADGTRVDRRAYGVDALHPRFRLTADAILPHGAELCALVAEPLTVSARCPTRAGWSVVHERTSVCP